MTRFRDLLEALSAAGVEFIVVGGVAAGGKYEDLLPHTLEIDVYGTRCRCLDLDELIRVKRAVGRPKDFEAVAELESIRDEKSKEV